MEENRAVALVEALQLTPHPEGGYYREVYRSHALTTIYFLLTRGVVSRWHRVHHSDEVWHFYEGDPVELTVADPHEETHAVRLGPVAPGQCPVHTVPASCWQSARSTGAYSLVGCTVAPPFSFENFELSGE
jgi:uncharacterized protein